MAMSRRDRYRLRTQLLELLDSDEWPWDRRAVLFGSFDVEVDGHNTFTDLIASVPDSDLVELYATAADLEVEEVEDTLLAPVDDGNWKRGYVRVFLSHSAAHKQFAGDVADQLAIVGIHGFVAHDTMAYSKPWQKQIEQALRSMQAFVALVHPEVNASPWCNQEAGWALGRRVPRFAVRLGADPAGFIGSDQWPSMAGRSAQDVADAIRSWIVLQPEFGDPIFDGLLAALAESGNYFDAGATAGRIAALGTLTDEQFARIDQVWWTNDQLYGGVLPSRAMEPLYRSNGKKWPIPKPEE